MNLQFSSSHNADDKLNFDRNSNVSEIIDQDYKDEDESYNYDGKKTSQSIIHERTPQLDDRPRSNRKKEITKTSLATSVTTEENQAANEVLFHQFDDLPKKKQIPF